MEKQNIGFTIIELIVVIAIIAILSSIIMMSVPGFIIKSKNSRFITDAKNIEKALLSFYVQYDNYPISQADYGDATEFYSSAPEFGGTGEPYLTVNGTNHYLSEFYKSDWSGYNAAYLVPRATLYTYLCDDTGDSKIDCGVVIPYDSNYIYGAKFIIKPYCACADWYGGEMKFTGDRY
jgi:prepilin-type N-terminal cleavage/methylation domain-containing protein